MSSIVYGVIVTSSSEVGNRLQEREIEPSSKIGLERSDDSDELAVTSEGAGMLDETT